MRLWQSQPHRGCGFGCQTSMRVTAVAVAVIRSITNIYISIGILYQLIYYLSTMTWSHMKERAILFFSFHFSILLQFSLGWYTWCSYQTTGKQQKWFIKLVTKSLWPVKELWVKPGQPYKWIPAVQIRKLVFIRGLCDQL